MMPIARLVLAFVATLYATSASAQGWIEFVEHTEMFTVNLPHDPAVGDIVWHSEWGAELPGKVFTASDGTTDYRVTVVDYSKSDLPPHSPTWDFYGAVDFAAWDIRKRGGDITYDAWTNVDRIAGHQMQVTNDDMSRTYATILSHAERLYIFEAIASPGAIPPIVFQQSMRILDEEGRVVRYDRDLRTRIGEGAE